MIRKFVATIILLFYFCSNASFALSELYYIKNKKVADVEPFVEASYEQRDFILLKKNPYYGKSATSNENFAVVVLQQSGENLFYFYNSNGYKKINNDIIKFLKSANIEYEKSYSANVISVYEEIAQKAINNPTTNYVFSQDVVGNSNYGELSSQKSFDSQEVNLQNTAEVPVKLQNALKGYVAQLSAGTKFSVYLQNSINTAIATEGEMVTAVLTANVNYQGYTVFPQGSILYGVLTKARHATYGSRNGRVVISFNQLVTPDNKIYNLSTEKIDFTVTNDGKVAAVAGNVAVGAIIGGLTGLLFGALSSGGNLGTAVAIGAGVGAGGALIGGTAERGVDAEIPSFTEIEIKLTAPVNVAINY